MVAPLPGDANQKTSRMDETSPLRPKQTLDKDLDKLVQVEEAATFLARGLVAPGIGLLFIVMAGVFAAIWVSGEPLALIIVMAAAIGGYMALNIGANDVANNVGPAVGARALTIGGALVIAAVFETAGALIAGGDVVETISRGIVAPEVMTNPMTFIWVMMSALIASALWINLATWIGAPVSTTHAIVGGVLGSGVAAAGFGSVDWTVVGAIAASWVISPVLGGVFAALVLAFIKVRIIYQDDKIVAARRWVPLLIGLMAGSFSAYLATKGLGHIIEPDGVHLALIGLACFLLGWGLSHIVVQRQSVGMENRNQSLRKLFRLPLICSAALLSFAHGANDVANAVGPLAAIVQAAEGGGVDAPLGHAHRSARHFGRPAAFRPQADQACRRADHQAQSDAGFLRRALGGDHCHLRLLVRHAGQFDPYRGRRRLRRRLLPRMVYGELVPPQGLYGTQETAPPG